MLATPVPNLSPPSNSQIVGKPENREPQEHADGLRKANRISSNLNSRTHKLGWLQASTTTIDFLSNNSARAYAIAQRFPVKACIAITSWKIVAVTATQPDRVGAFFPSDG